MADHTDAEILRLTRTDTGHQYDIYPIEEAGDSQTKDAFSIAPPGLGPTDNILMGVSGMQSDISIQGFIWNDGQDRANGTAPTGTFTNDTVVTLSEQVRWLRDHLHAPTFSATWELDHVTGSMYDSRPVFFERLDVPTISNDSPRWRSVRIGLRVGKSVG